MICFLPLFLMRSCLFSIDESLWFFAPILWFIWVLHNGDFTQHFENYFHIICSLILFSRDGIKEDARDERAGKFPQDEPAWHIFIPGGETPGTQGEMRSSSREVGCTAEIIHQVKLFLVSSLCPGQFHFIVNPPPKKCIRIKPSTDINVKKDIKLVHGTKDVL